MASLDLMRTRFALDGAPVTLSTNYHKSDRMQGFWPGCAHDTKEKSLMLVLLLMMMVMDVSRGSGGGGFIGPVFI